MNFITLLTELRTELDKHGLILTAAVSAGAKTIDTAYDIPALAGVLDYLHLMSYDYHGSWEKTTHHNAPLESHPMDEGDDLFHNVVRSNTDVREEYVYIP